MFTEYTFPSSDGKSTIAGYQWAPEGTPVAILQIAHGVGEHCARYADFAEYLNKFGIVVVGNDHIGHGKSCAPEDWGYFGPKDGWKYFVEDVELNRRLAIEKFPGIPHYILGHSMGSFVCRTYIAKYGGNINGAIIMGTAGKNPAVGAGLALVGALRKIKGDRFYSDLIKGMAFGSYNDRIKPALTPYDWLSVNPANVEKYNADPSCGFDLTLAGYADMFHLLQYINTDECFQKTPKDKRYFIVAGGDDPVGAYGEGPSEVFGKFKAFGIEKVDIKIYDGMRHEILNENDKETVYEDMKNFVLG